MELCEVTAADQGLLRAWHGVYVRADAEGRADHATPWQLGELRAALAHPDPGERQIAVLGLVEGAAVAASLIRWPQLDNPELALAEVYVDPPVRRRGHGSTMVAEVERRSRAQGRSVLVGEVKWPYGRGGDGGGWPGVEFARAHGARLVLGDVQRRLVLPVDAGRLDELAALAAPHHEGYVLRRFVGPVPEELIAAYAALDAAVETEAPTGDLAIEPATPDPDSVRAANLRLAAQGRTRLVTMAFAAERPVGYTEIVVPDADPGRAYQWGTLVERAHRGHRLGLALKVANLRLLQGERPEVGEVTTWNAEVNAAMIAVNDALGFVPVGRMGEFQKRL